MIAASAIRHSDQHFLSWQEVFRELRDRFDTDDSEVGTRNRLEKILREWPHRHSAQRYMQYRNDKKMQKVIRFKL